MNNSVDIHIIVLDDEPYFWDARKPQFTPSKVPITWIAVVENREDFYRLVDQHQPDVVFIDIKLRGGSFSDNQEGLEALWQIKEDFPGIKCVVCTNYRNDDWFVEALAAGAEAIIPKIFPSGSYPTMSQIIETVCLGGLYYDPQAVRPLVSRLKQSDSSPESRQTQLSGKPQTVIKFCVICQKANGKVPTNKEIAKSFFLSINTIKKHFDKIFVTLGIHDRNKAIDSIKEDWKGVDASFYEEDLDLQAALKTAVLEGLLSDDYQGKMSF